MARRSRAACSVFALVAASCGELGSEPKLASTGYNPPARTSGLNSSQSQPQTRKGAINSGKAQPLTGPESSDDSPLLAHLMASSLWDQLGLTQCRATLGDTAWAQAYHFATQDFVQASVQQHANTRAAMTILASVCPRPVEADIAARKNLLARLAEGTAEEAAPSRKKHALNLSRFLAVTVPVERIQVLASLTRLSNGDTAQDWWPAVAAWHDQLAPSLLPPPAYIHGYYISPFSGLEPVSSRILMEHLRDLEEEIQQPTPEESSWRRYHPDIPPDRQEGAQSIQTAEDNARASTRRLLSTLELNAEAVLFDFHSAIEGVENLIRLASNGTRPDLLTSISMAHAQMTPAENLRITSMVVNNLKDNLRFIPRSRDPGDLPLGPATLPLVWLAMNTYFESQPQAQADQSVAKNIRNMQATLLRGLTESMENRLDPPSKSLSDFGYTCMDGMGTRIMRTLQGFYPCVTVDGELIPNPTKLLNALGAEFFAAHPEPRDEDIASFERNCLERGADVYANDPAAMRAFRRQLAPQVDEMRDP